MRLRTAPDGLLIADRDRWVSLPAALKAAGSADAQLAAAATDVLSFLRAGDDTRAAAAAVLVEVRDDASVAGDPAPPGCRSGRARSARSCCGSRTSSQSSRDARQALLPARRRGRPSAASSASPAARSPSSSPTSASARRRRSTSPTTPSMLADGAGHVVAAPHQGARLRARAGVRAAPGRSSTPRPRRRSTPSAAGSCSTTGAPATCRPTTRGATSSGRSIKAKTFANSIGCDVVTADALARLDSARPAASASTASCGARARTAGAAAHARRDARLRLGRRAARRRRRHLHRHDARLLRAGDRALDPARARPSSWRSTASAR